MYELVVIATTDDAEAKVEKHFKDLAATFVKSQKMGNKQLAYPVNKVTEAQYLSWTFDAAGDAVFQLNGRLRLEQEAILRYLITKVSKVSEVSKVKEQPPEEQKEKPKVTVTTKVKTSQNEKVSVKSAKDKGGKSTRSTKGTKEKGKKS